MPLGGYRGGYITHFYSAIFRERIRGAYLFFTGATGRISGHTPTLNTSLYVVLARVVPLEG